MVVRMKYCITPSKMSGAFVAPPSKSETHRALICCALGGGRVLNPGVCDDTRATARALETLKNGGGKIDCAQSGSTLRFLLPVAAAMGVEAEFVCDKSLISRPVTPLLDALCANGVRAEIGGSSVFVSGKLQSGFFELPGNISSQFVSGLLFACPLLSGESKISVKGELQSTGYVDLTLSFLKKCGVVVKQEDNCFYIDGKYGYCGDLTVGGDWSGAAALLAAGMLGGSAECRGLDINSVQPDSKFALIAEKFGSPLIIYNNSIIARSASLRAVSADISSIPDLAPVLCAVASVSEGTSVFTGAQRLAYKETNRLETVCASLAALGADISADNGVLTVRGKEYLNGGESSAYGDHRIAMALAAVSPRCKNPVIIDGFDTVTKSYPGFAADFSAIGGEINVI